MKIVYVIDTQDYVVLTILSLLFIIGICFDVRRRFGKTRDDPDDDGEIY